jgi:hypothetical protein
LTCVIDVEPTHKGGEPPHVQTVQHDQPRPHTEGDDPTHANTSTKRRAEDGGGNAAEGEPAVQPGPRRKKAKQVLPPTAAETSDEDNNGSIAEGNPATQPRPPSCKKGKSVRKHVKSGGKVVIGQNKFNYMSK